MGDDEDEDKDEDEAVGCKRRYCREADSAQIEMAR